MPSLVPLHSAARLRALAHVVVMLARSAILTAMAAQAGARHQARPGYLILMPPHLSFAEIQERHTAYLKWIHVTKLQCVALCIHLPDAN